MNSQSFEFHELKRIEHLVAVSSRKGDKLLPRIRMLVREMESLENPAFWMVVKDGKSDGGKDDAPP